MNLLENINTTTINETIKALGTPQGRDVKVLDFSAETVASNLINGGINGESVQQSTFSNTHGETMNDVFKTNLENHPDVGSVEVSGSTFLRVRIIGAVEGVALDITSAFVVTAGASQPTITVNTDQSVTGLVEAPSQIVKDPMAIGGTKKVLIGPATAEVQTITTVADVSSSLDGTWFKLDSADGSKYYVWINVDAGGNDPGITGRTAVAVAISADDADTVVATAVASAINALGDFAAPAPGAAVVTVTDANSGVVDDIVDGLAPTGFAFAVTTSGAGIQTFTKAYAIVFDQASVLSSIVFDDDVVGNTTAVVGPTFAEGTQKLWGFSSIELASGLATVHTLE